MRYLLIGLMIALGLVTISCSSEQSPAKATNGFVAAIKDGDYTQARKFLTQDANIRYSDTDLKNFQQEFTAEGIVTQANPDKLVVIDNNATIPICREWIV